MITLYGLGTILPEGRGETKDLRAQWALEEAGLPYRVRALDHTGGELDGDAHRRIYATGAVACWGENGEGQLGREGARRRRRYPSCCEGTRRAASGPGVDSYLAMSIRWVLVRRLIERADKHAEPRRM